MTKAKRVISLLMVITMLTSLCGMFAINTSAASNNTILNPLWGTQRTKTWTTRTYWSDKKVYIYADVTNAAIDDKNVDESAIKANVAKYARFKVTVTASGGYKKTYNVTAGSSITLPAKFGRKYTITITSSYANGMNYLARAKAISYGSYSVVIK